MNLLTVSNISKQYSERLLFDGANLLINDGDRIGLIGVNGSGKSTLLRLVSGLETPDGGGVTVWGGVKVEFLAQEPELDEGQTVLNTIFQSDSPQMVLLRQYEEVTAALQQTPDDALLQEQLVTVSAEMDRTEGWAAEANAKAILTRLQIADFDAPIQTLSGGQRKRVALARALIDRADLLVLDEPTNHIDAETVAWLEDYLASTPGAILMVTHDRYFLDRVVNQIVELDRRQLFSYPGNYSKYLADRDARHDRMAAAEEKRRKHIARELEWMRRAPMARGTKQKARKQRAEELMEIRYDSGDDQVMIAMASSRLGSKVLTVKGLSKAYDQNPVVREQDFHLEPGDRIGIIGPNGSGKSTFLNLLAGQITPDDGHIDWGNTVRLGYYDQRSMNLDDNLRIIDFVEKEAALIHSGEERPHWLPQRNNASGTPVEAAKMLEWFLFPRSMQYGRIGTLSGGERRRLYLLRTLIHQPNVLFLDEPTNDLDVQTLAVLEEYLDHFQGSLVVVSHDRYFMDRTVDSICYYEDGRLGPRYPSPYSTFKRLRDDALRTQSIKNEPAKPLAAQPNSTKQGSIQQGTNSQDSAVSSDAQPNQQNRQKKLSWKEEREFEALEETIEKLEARKAELMTEMAQIGNEYTRLQGLSNELENLESELEEKLERWLELGELAA
ncbi:MAG: ABC-F family ATP-binding cassette domain-containing protein [Chloroflexota bacterium]